MSDGGGGGSERLVGLFILHPFLLIVIFDIYFVVFYKEKLQVYIWLSDEGKCIVF